MPIATLLPKPKPFQNLLPKTNLYVAVGEYHRETESRWCTVQLFVKLATVHGAPTELSLSVVLANCYIEVLEEWVKNTWVKRHDFKVAYNKTRLWIPEALLIRQHSPQLNKQQNSCVTLGLSDRGYWSDR